jgi:flagellin
MNTVNSNISALTSINSLRVNSRNMSQAMERLSTGKRINSGADDPAGMVISTRLQAFARADRVAVSNANDAISVLQTWSAAGQNMLDAVMRMKELAVLGATDTLQGFNRLALDAEYFQLGAEWTRIAANTRWNEIVGMGQNTTLTIHVGNRQDIQILNKSWNPADQNAAGDNNVTGATAVAGDTDNNATKTLAFEFIRDLAGVAPNPTTANSRSADHIQSRAASNEAVTKLDTAIAGMTKELANYGSYINRLEITVDNLSGRATQLDASRSKIEDSNYATESTELSRTQIIAQAATAILAQANASQQSVLALLQ